MIGRLIGTAIGNTVLKTKLAIVVLPFYGLYLAGKAVYNASTAVYDKVDDIREHNQQIAEQNRRSAEATREATEPLYRARKEAERIRVHAEMLKRQQQWEALRREQQEQVRKKVSASNRLAILLLGPISVGYIWLLASQNTHTSDNKDVPQEETQSGNLHDFYYIPKRGPYQPRYDAVPTPYTTNQQNNASPDKLQNPTPPQQQNSFASNTTTTNENAPRDSPANYDDASNPVNATIVEEQVPDAAQSDAAQSDAAQSDAAQSDAAQQDGAQQDGAQQDGAQQDGGTIPASTTPSSVPADSMQAYAGLNSGLSDVPLDVADLRYSYITNDFLTSKSLRALSISYNGIYAIHGCTFRRPSLQQYFSRFSWYKPNTHFSDRDLSDIEKHNIRTIRAYERDHFGY